MQAVVIYLDYKELDLELDLVLIIFQVYYQQEIFYKVFHLVMEIARSGMEINKRE
jgi:hypothetical protein